MVTSSTTIRAWPKAASTTVKTENTAAKRLRTKVSTTNSTTWHAMSISSASAREPTRATLMSRCTASPLTIVIATASPTGSARSLRCAHQNRGGLVDLDAFVAEHEAEWRRLQVLSRRRRLSAREADELVVLYQRAATHLSAVRSRLPDPSLVARLSQLVLSARAALTGGRSFAWRDVGRFFTHGFPLVLYRARRWWVTTALLCLGFAAVVGFWLATHP